MAIFEDLAKKSVLVTGASGGLGLHMAALLARYGCRVTLAARRVDRLGTEVRRLTATGYQVEAITLDVTDPASVASAFADPPRIWDIVVNNAGISGAQSSLDADDETWQDVLDTNLTGAFRVARAAARSWKDSERTGTILNMASITGLRIAGGLTAYSASKAALISLTRSCALEWARFGIRVNALCPGYIETDINRAFFATPAGEAMIRRIPQRRLGTPENLDGAVLLLCSDAGAYITGATLAVDGGHLVSSL